MGSKGGEDAAGAAAYVLAPVPTQLFHFLSLSMSHNSALPLPPFDSWIGKICWRRDRLPRFLGFPCGSAGEESACNAGDLGLIPKVGKIPWRRERLPTPVFWPREFRGLYSPWSRKESDTTEPLSPFHFHFQLASVALLACFV